MENTSTVFNKKTALALPSLSGYSTAMNKSNAIDLPGRIIAAFRMNDRLERLPRTGYLLTGVPHPETVAAHAYATAWLTMLLAGQLADTGETIDSARAVGMALLHEAGEIFIGDLVPGVSRVLGPGVKEQSELEYGGRFLDALAPAMGELFREYMAGTTAEALLVRDCDRLALLLKTAGYRRDGCRGVAPLLSPDKYTFCNKLCGQIADRVFRELAAEDPGTDGSEPPWEGPAVE